MLEDFDWSICCFFFFVRESWILWRFWTLGCLGWSKISTFSRFTWWFRPFFPPQVGHVSLWFALICDWPFTFWSWLQWMAMVAKMNHSPEYYLSLVLLHASPFLEQRRNLCFIFTRKPERTVCEIVHLTIPETPLDDSWNPTWRFRLLPKNALDDSVRFGEYYLKIPWSCGTDFISYVDFT